MSDTHYPRQKTLWLKHASNLHLLLTILLGLAVMELTFFTAAH